MMIWFCEYPWVLTSSVEDCDHARLHTWDPVSVLCRHCPVSTFQNLMVRSAVPPPVASKPCYRERHRRWSMANGASRYLVGRPRQRLNSCLVLQQTVDRCGGSAAPYEQLVVVASRGQVLVVGCPP